MQFVGGCFSPRSFPLTVFNFYRKISVPLALQESSKVVADVMAKHFGDLPVYVNVGNHESFPVNMFPGEGEEGKYSPSWLYAGMADFFRRWLPGEREQVKEDRFDEKGSIVQFLKYCS